MANFYSWLHGSFSWYPDGTIPCVCSGGLLSRLPSHILLKGRRPQHYHYQGCGWYRMSSKKVHSPSTYLLVFYFTRFRIKHKRNRLLVSFQFKISTNQLVPPFSQCLDYGVRLFFYRIVSSLGPRKCPWKKATGHPDCLSEAAIAQSEASVSTTRRTDWSTAEIAISIFIFWNALIVKQDKGKVDTCVNGCIFCEKRRNPLGTVSEHTGSSPYFQGFVIPFGASVARNPTLWCHF